MTSMTPKEKAERLSQNQVLGCNCDLDNWEPTLATGHSHVCRIHKAALAFSASEIEALVKEKSGAD